MENDFVGSVHFAEHTWMTEYGLDLDNFQV